MEEVIRTCLGIILWMIVTCRLATAQVLLEELQQLKIDPLDLNGTEPYTELTIDEIISRARGGNDMAQNLTLTDDGKVLAELDMRLTHEQFYNLYDRQGNYNDSLPRRKRSKTGWKLERSKRKAILRWPESVVPYRFVTGHFTGKDEYMIRTAMKDGRSTRVSVSGPQSGATGMSCAFRTALVAILNWVWWEVSSH
ncbi:hypothetical protein DPMN_165297 [Dreissena polymorpha]|uniref:Uncharacterized protein n=1 Tax=Dreissena polymorpha TaxID=45954 RepID=A0A9D4IWF7_DREPO|nr:hypothetical protein DPMN_165297 [Dreissena polymorpha]